MCDEPEFLANYQESATEPNNEINNDTTVQDQGKTLLISTLFPGLTSEEKESVEFFVTSNGQDYNSLSDKDISSTDLQRIGAKVGDNFFVSPKMAKKAEKGEINIYNKKGELQKSFHSNQFTIQVFTPTQMQMLSHFIMAQTAIIAARKRIEEEKRIAEEEKQHKDEILQQSVRQHLDPTTYLKSPLVEKDVSVKEKIQGFTQQVIRKFEKQVAMLFIMLDILKEAKVKEKEKKKLDAKKADIVATTTTTTIKQNTAVSPDHQEISKEKSVQSTFGFNIQNKIIKQIK